MGIILSHLNKNNSMGNIIVISGPPHTGKSTLLCNVFEKALKDGFEIITTVDLRHASKKVHYITNMIELLESYANCKGNVIIAIDDAQAIFDSTAQATTRKSKMNLPLYVYIAKFQANFIYVGHDPYKIPTSLLSFGPLIVYCVKPGRMEIQGRIYPYSRSRLVPHKAQFSGFDYEDFPMDQLFNELSKIRADSNEELISENKKAIRKFISKYTNTNKKYDVPKQKQMEIVIKRLEPFMGKTKRINQQFIADMFEVTQPRISAIRKKMKLT